MLSGGSMRSVSDVGSGGMRVELQIEGQSKSEHCYNVLRLFSAVKLLGDGACHVQCKVGDPESERSS